MEKVRGKQDKKKKNKPEEKTARAEGQKENGGSKEESHKAEICLYLQWG